MKMCKKKEFGKRENGKEFRRREKRRENAYIIIYTYINEVLAKTFARSWDGFRPVSGVCIRSFPIRLYQ